jgi:glycosyltransferase involved in cell wall biosynthesis
MPERDAPLTAGYLAPELGSLTSTFVYREIAALRERGVHVRTYSTHLRRDGAVFSEEAQALIDDTVYLTEMPKGRVLAKLAHAMVTNPVRTPGVVALAVRDATLARVQRTSDRPKLLWHCALGICLARMLRRDGVEHLHAHFGHVPAAITMYAAAHAGIPYSFTVHANDIFVRGVALREKVRRAAFVACISEYNRRFLAERGCDAGRCVIVRCAIDAARFPFDGTPRPEPPLIYTVCRLVEKKGIPDLLRALAVLKREGTPFRCLVAGDGPLFDETARLRAELGLDDAVELPGALPQERVQALHREGAAFVLPCVEARDGDLDGIPVALMEAMALGTPVVSTGVSGIPELIESGGNGLLAPPHDPEKLAGQLRRLLTEPALRAELARNARATIESRFELGASAERLHGLFEQAVRTGGVKG